MLSRYPKVITFIYLNILSNHIVNSFCRCKTQLPLKMSKYSTVIGRHLSSSSAPKKIIAVFGGNGFVGQHVCKNALFLGLDVISISRSGPPAIKQNWHDNVKWISGDAAEAWSWNTELQHATGVVSCIGAFGTNEVRYLRALIFLYKYCISSKTFFTSGLFSHNFSMLFHFYLLLSLSLWSGLMGI